MEALDLPIGTPEAAHSPVLDVSVGERGADAYEIVAELVPDTTDPAEIEASYLVGRASRTSANSD